MEKTTTLVALLEKRGVQLIPDGTDRFKARCPFPDHEDLTPSFTIYPTDNRYHCFGCGKSGDVIDFVQAMDGLDFQEARRWLDSEKAWVPKPNVSAASIPHAAALAAKATERREWILREYAWDLDRIPGESPTVIGDKPTHQFLGIFHHDAVIWTGAEHDSGRRDSEKRFMTRMTWQLLLDRAPSLVGPKICPSIFMPGSRHRSNANVIARPYLVVEGDAVIGRSPSTKEEKQENKAGCAAVARWMRSTLNMHLAAIVDTGNKSLHAWFHWPGDEAFEELVVIAPSLGLDAQVMRNASQPVRLPGFAHEKTGQASRLLYLDLSIAA